MDDRSVHVGGLQRVQTIQGHIIPLNIQNGLPRFVLRPFTDDEWKTLPHVVMTSKAKWDPSVMDYAMSGGEVDDTGPSNDTEMSFPSPPTQAFKPIALVCGETVEHGEPNQVIPSTLVCVTNGTSVAPTDGGASMKNAKGEAIQFTSSLEHAPGTVIHQPLPWAVPTNGTTKSQVLFDHILDGVLDRGDESVLKRALIQEGFDSLPSLAAMDDRLIGSLSFLDDG